MNATTAIESTALAAAEPSQVGALELITLDPARYVAEVFKPFRTKFDALKAEAALIHFKDDRLYDEPHKYVDISTTAGMAVAVKYRAAFRDDVRIDGEKARVERKAPILMIGKLLDSEYKTLAGDAAPYEAMFDDAIKSEEGRKEAIKQAKIAAERERQERVNALISVLAMLPVVHAHASAAELADVLTEWDGWAADPAIYEEDAARAADTLAASLLKLRDLLTARQQAEAAALAAEQSRIAELARIEAERIENARVAAENDRVAAEQAAEAKRLADLAAQQQAAILAQQEEAQAKIDAQADLMAEQSRKLAEQQAAADARDAAALKAQQDAARREDDHGPALLMNAEFNAAREAERVRLQDLHSQAAADLVAPEPSITDLADALADDLDPTDIEIAAVGFDFGLTMPQWIERLTRFVALSPEAVAAFEA